MDLRSFYARSYAPAFLADARPRTHKAYDQALTLFERAMGHIELDQISTATLADFKARLAERPGRKGRASPATVNKHLRHVQAVLNKAGPPGPGNRDALGILARTPWTKPLRAPNPAPRAIPAEHLSRPRSCSLARTSGLSSLDFCFSRRTRALRRGRMRTQPGRVL